MLPLRTCCAENSALNRNVSLDILRFSMALSVVGLHAGFLADLTPLGSCLTVNGIFRIAVPVFLLINGFYFYPVLIKGKSADWLKRVLYLYVFWMLFSHGVGQNNPYNYFWFICHAIILFIAYGLAVFLLVLPESIKSKVLKPIRR